MEDILHALEDGHVGARFPAGTREVFVDRDGLVIAPVQQELPIWTIPTWTDMPVELPLRVIDKASSPGPAAFDRQVAHVRQEALRFPLVLRPWQLGDRMRPAGLGGSKLVSDILVDAKVPLHRKRNAYVLISGDRIIWLCGLRLAEGAAADPGGAGAISLEWLGGALVS
jgi:tRNA(Ile)-lysidine synthase